MEVVHTWTPEVEAAVKAAALEAGFHLSGIAAAEPADTSAESSEAERFRAWVEAGRAAEMEYLKRRNDEGDFLRSGLRVAIPWARSIVVCALNYNSAQPRSTDPSSPANGWIGRYAWSGRRASEDAAEMVPTDYHDELLTRLRLVETRLRDLSPCETRCYVDTGPIVERGYAAKAGVGWIGKNTCVINQGMGSWLLLGVIVTSLPVAPDRPISVAADRCGSCTRCIDACPTDALVAPREMDASRCIAYLTIEKKGEIPVELREDMGRQVFGCDICQDVCPWNRKAPIGVTAGMETREKLVNPGLKWLASMDSRFFKQWFNGSPLKRTGRKRLHRNVAIAMGNSGQAEFVPRLQEWEAGEDAVLAEAARWALARIREAGGLC